MQGPGSQRWSSSEQGSPTAPQPWHSAELPLAHHSEEQGWWPSTLDQEECKALGRQAECCGGVWQLHTWRATTTLGRARIWLSMTQSLPIRVAPQEHCHGSTTAQQTSRFQLSPQYFTKGHLTCTKGLIKELCALLGVREPTAQNKILITQTPPQEHCPF